MNASALPLPDTGSLALPLSMPLFHARLLEAMHQGLAIIREMLAESRPFDAKLFRCCLSLVKSKPALQDSHDPFPAELLASLEFPPSAALQPHATESHPAAAAPATAPAPASAQPAHREVRPTPPATPAVAPAPAPRPHIHAAKPTPNSVPLAHCSLAEQLRAEPLNSLTPLPRRPGLPRSATTLLAAAGLSPGR